MKQLRLLMGMPITVEVIDQQVVEQDINDVFDYFDYVDHKFSTFKPDSEISKINNSSLTSANYSQDMQTVLKLAELTKKQTDGYFDITHRGRLDPSGLVKGWAILNAASILKRKHLQNYYVEAGGDIAVSGLNSQGQKWHIGIRNPFNKSEIVKVLYVKDHGVATSGTYERGQHVYNPKKDGHLITEILSLTVIGPNVYEADRFATAAFAMEKAGIHFIEKTPDLEGYMIDKDGIATFTSGFDQFTKP